jgi:hypothetical protein
MFIANIRTQSEIFELNYKKHQLLFGVIRHRNCLVMRLDDAIEQRGNTKGGSITVLLTSCLTGLDSAVSQMTILFLFAKQTNPNQSNRRSMV